MTWIKMDDVKPDDDYLIFIIKKDLKVTLGECDVKNQTVLCYSLTNYQLSFSDILYWTFVIIPPAPIGGYKNEN